jgi:Alpha-L-rhamnosidase N-terminal domain.
MAAWTAKWIWIDGTRGMGQGTGEDDLQRNFYLCARKTFDVPKDLQTAILRITADARYVLFVNGQRIGNGPIRGWQHSWFYDTYDLTPHCVPANATLSACWSSNPARRIFNTRWGAAVYWRNWT